MSLTKIEEDLLFYSKDLLEQIDKFPQISKKINSKYLRDVIENAEDIKAEGGDQ